MTSPKPDSRDASAGPRPTQPGAPTSPSDVRTAPDSPRESSPSSQSPPELAARSHAHARMLRWVGLSEDDAHLGEALQSRLIRPRVDAIIEHFYAELMRHPEARVLVSDDATLSRLRGTQRAYLCSLAIDFTSSAYYASRLAIGAAHARVGLPLPLFQLSAGWLLDGVLAHCDDACWQRDRDLLRLARRVLALDVAIASEAYHQQRIATLRGSIARLQDRVRRDPLTGAASRDFTLDTLRDALDLAGPERPLAVLVTDIDYFKRINDSWGHVVGDQVLHEIAQRMIASVRDQDLVGRWGGEEFVVVMQATALDEALAVGERIRHAVADQPFLTTAGELGVTASVGIALATGGDDIETLVGRADQAMYESKAAGRNLVTVDRRAFVEAER